MAEALAVLGVLSNALQIVQFLTDFATRIHSLIKPGQDSSARNALPQTREMTEEYNNIAQNILELQDSYDSINGLDDSDNDVKRVAKKCQMEAEAMLSAIKSLTEVSSGTVWSRLKEATQKAAIYNKCRNEIAQKHRHLRELIQLLSTAVATTELKYRPLQRMSDHLEFSDMQRRGDSITPAWPDTYEWTLKDDCGGLRQWLQKDRGIFWITGKPGAGKSTLMKFLSHSPETSRLLKTWCGQSELLLVSFYFYYLGSPLQKSIEGLLRSIIYQIIWAVKELAPLAFPEYYSPRLENNSPHPSDSRQRHWTYDDLYSGLKRILKRGSSATWGKKICFFIDGLDEYSVGNDQGNHVELVQILIDLSRYEYIKLCVASRPWNTFRNAFELRCPTLKLEDLTEPDIRAYVYGNARKLHTLTSSLFQQHNQTEPPTLNDIDLLIEEIVLKAEGVFLWVRLVMKAVERGFAEGDSIRMLLHRVKEFPPDLDDFFDKLILDRMDTSYLTQSSQALFLAYRYFSTRGVQKVSSFVDYWIISLSPEGIRSAQTLLSPLPTHSRTSMLAATKTFLSASCKDLLILDTSSRQTQTATVQFLHRTVFDFLAQDRIYTAIVANLPPLFMDNRRIFHLLCLAKLRLLRPEDTPTFARNLVDYCLLRTHQDLRLDWVECIWAVVETLSPEQQSSTIPQVIGSMIAFRDDRGHKEAWNTVNNVVNLRDDIKNNIRFYVACTLGLHPGRHLNFDEVDIPQLQRILDKASRFNTAGNLKSPLGPYTVADDTTQTFANMYIELGDHCSENVWQAFLRRLAILESMGDEANLKELAAARELTKLLLQFVPPAKNDICCRPRNLIEEEDIPIGLDCDHTHDRVDPSNLILKFTADPPESIVEMPVPDVKASSVSVGRSWWKVIF